MPIGEDTPWLMIHLANCGDFDKMSKRPWKERIDWVNANRGRIEDVARNPIGTVDWWRDADQPFSFVAACKELAAAWDNPDYVTHLPLCFDGSCSGVQHLAMMMRDEVAGRMVNLMSAHEPQDIYAVITRKVRDNVEAELDDWARRTKRIDGKDVLLRPRAEHANFWIGKIDRKLIKRPAMTFGYSATVDGMKEQIVEAYKERRYNAEPTNGAAMYLAGHTNRAAKAVLKRPAEAMRFMRALAKIRADKNLHLEWTTPTGFPVVTRYLPPNERKAHLEIDGVGVKWTVADGWLPDMDEESKLKAKNGAAPNFTHSMDAAHLVRVVNEVGREGISIAVVHDSFACLAPQARALHRILRQEFALLYASDVLAELRGAAKRDLGAVELPPAPDKGSLEPMAVCNADYPFA
jgi:DNA-directed RNA polymerase, mitochondrial